MCVIVHMKCDVASVSDVRGYDHGFIENRWFLSRPITKMEAVPVTKTPT